MSWNGGVRQLSIVRGIIVLNIGQIFWISGYPRAYKCGEEMAGKIRFDRKEGRKSVVHA